LFAALNNRELLDMGVVDRMLMELVGRGFLLPSLVLLPLVVEGIHFSCLSDTEKMA